MKRLSLLAMLLCAGTMALAQSALPAFPGAEGFGRYAKGARGADAPTIYHVTNLNNAGPGSFRDAVSQPGRIVVFDTCGVIHITEGIAFKSNQYVAGQTAPGDGIIIYGNSVSASGTSNLIVRYLRMFMGVNGSSGKDASGVSNGSDIIFDHCTFLWGIDENFSVNWDKNNVEPTNITVQHSIIGQGLWSHSAGGLIQTDGGVSLIGDLYIDNKTRNPKVKGLNQFVNNVLYNWQGSLGYILGGSTGNSWAHVEGNYFISGPQSGDNPFSSATPTFQVYQRNNFIDGNKDGSRNGALADASKFGGVTMRNSLSDFTLIPNPHPALSSILTPEQALDRVIASAGASLPARSEVEDYLIGQLLSYGTKGSLISHEMLNGIYENVGIVSIGARPADSDSDGIPDAWEDANGLNKNSAADALAPAADGSGYLNIESYLNSISAPVSAYVRTAAGLNSPVRDYTSVGLAWRNRQADADNIIVQVSTDGVAFTDALTVAGNAESATISNLSENTTYYFRLLTKKGAMTSTPSMVLRRGTMGHPAKPLACEQPAPADNGASRFYTSVSLKWVNATEEWSQPVTYNVYVGSSSGSLVKVADGLTEAAFDYTPATPFSQKTGYFWRVDAINAIGTTEGAVWTFNTTTYSSTPSFADLGEDFISGSSKSDLIPARSGNLLTVSKTSYELFAGTDSAVLFKGGGGTTVPSDGRDGVYLPKGEGDVVEFWRITTGSYLDVALTNDSRRKNISKLTLNGTSSSITAGENAEPVCLFSDCIPFSTQSVIGYEQPVLPVARAGAPAITVEAPVGAKSVRIYSKVTLTTIGDNLYAVDASGDRELGTDNTCRLAYIAVHLEEIKNDNPNASAVNTIEAISLNGKPLALDNSGKALDTLPYGTVRGAMTVDYTLTDPNSSGSPRSGVAHSFADGDYYLLVTAENGSERTYTISLVGHIKIMLYLNDDPKHPAIYDSVFCVQGPVGELPVPIRQGYRFVEWNSRTSGKGTTYTPDVVLTTDKDLFAIWEEVPEEQTAVSADAWPMLNAYPNPASANLTVSGLAGGETLTLVDLSGQKFLIETAAQRVHTLNISRIPDGIYLLRVSDGNRTKALKIIVR